MNCDREQKFSQKKKRKKHLGTSMQEVLVCVCIPQSLVIIICALLLRFMALREARDGVVTSANSTRAATDLK